MCPSNVLTHVKSDKAHILIVESAEEVATHWSTGENRTHQMPFLWPRKVPKDEPSDIFQIYEEKLILQSSFNASKRYQCSVLMLFDEENSHIIF